MISITLHSQAPGRRNQVCKCSRASRGKKEVIFDLVKHF